MVKDWKRRNSSHAHSSNNRKDSNNIIPWASEFPAILNQNRKEKKLVPNSVITYCRPPTIGSYLLNYRKIAHGHHREIHLEIQSHKCGRCGLCGNFGSLENMVADTDKLRTKDGKIFFIKYKLNCKNFGVYAGQCVKCGDIYVGQTKNRFNTRWNHHRTVWRKMQDRGVTTETGDEAALYLHYAKCHPDATNNLALSGAYRVFFFGKSTDGIFGCDRKFLGQ